MWFKKKRAEEPVRECVPVQNVQVQCVEAEPGRMANMWQSLASSVEYIIGQVKAAEGYLRQYGDSRYDHMLRELENAQRKAEIGEIWAAEHALHYAGRDIEDITQRIVYEAVRERMTKDEFQVINDIFQEQRNVRFSYHRFLYDDRFSNDG